MPSEKLFIIIPSIRSDKIRNTIRSCQHLYGFQEILIVVCGKSAYNEVLIHECAGQENIFFANHKPEMEVIYPGKARNLGLDFIKANLNPRGDDYILMVDDDIVLPADYADELRKFIQSDPEKKAVMGRVESRPVNLATRVVDYSNFYYLQLKLNMNKVDWMLTTCTLSVWKFIADYLFDENVLVGEDVLFFNQLKTNEASFGVCASTTALHYHSRYTFAGVLKYQYQNGLLHMDWHHPRRCSLRMLLGRTLVLVKKSCELNRRVFLKHPLLFIGVVASFFAMSLGVEIGSHRLKKKIRS